MSRNIKGIRIHGMCIIYPNNRAVMPASEIEFVDTCKEVGLELNVKSNIIRALECMYECPVHGSQNLKGQNNQPLYRELENIIREMPEYIELKEKIESERKRRAEAKPKGESPIERYIIEQRRKTKKRTMTAKIIEAGRHK